MNRDIEDSASDDALDDAIREAIRVEADEHQLAHLERFWRGQSQRERWRRKFRRAMASAAAAIALVAAVVLVWHREKERESAQVNQDSPRKLVDSDSAKRPLADDTKSIEPSPSVGRPPTAYERFVFAARSGVEVHPRVSAAKIDDAIERMASNADADPAQVLDLAGLKRADAEMLLLRRLPSAPADQQHAMLRLLAGCGSQRSALALVRLARNESFRTEALTRLEQIVGIDGLAQAIGNSSDANVRSALILRLLTADSQAGLLGYLSLVRNDATRAEALSVATKSPNIPIAELITLLDHVEEPVRVAAALTLGHVNGPDTTRQLITRVTEQPANSPEAWIALMACRGEMSREFLDYATRRPQLLGHYNNARVRWGQMIP